MIDLANWLDVKDSKKNKRMIPNIFLKNWVIEFHWKMWMTVGWTVDCKNGLNSLSLLVTPCLLPCNLVVTSFCGWTQPQLLTFALANRICFSEWDTNTDMKWGDTLGHACLYYCHCHEKDKPGAAHWSQKENEGYGSSARLPQPRSVDTQPFPHMWLRPANINRVV